MSGIESRHIYIRDIGRQLPRHAPFRRVHNYHREFRVTLSDTHVRAMRGRGVGRLGSGSHARHCGERKGSNDGGGDVGGGWRKERVLLLFYGVVLKSRFSWPVSRPAAETIYPRAWAVDNAT